MTSYSIIAHFGHIKQRILARIRPKPHKIRPNLHQLARRPEQLPGFVQESSVAMRYLHLLESLAWDQFPERNLAEKRGTPPVPYAPFAAACLVKVDQQFVYMSQLRQYLVDHPALVWVLGFPVVASSRFSWGFDVEASLPTQRHFTRMLRQIPNQTLQFLLDSSVTLLQTELDHVEQITEPFGRRISLDTKHILAWVEENNPKAYLSESVRLDKNHQPKADPDCKLGCKRKRNQPPPEENDEQPITPTKNPRRPTNFSANDEYYWGYASGVVATKIPGWGEFALAELTQTFDRDDLTYFFPLLKQVQRRLGRKPAFGAFDAAFDAFYVYEYFHHAGGFAAVPFVGRGGFKSRSFNEEGLPLCQAGLAMPLKSTYWSKSSLVQHECGRYACPLLFPHPTAQSCPIDHKNWSKGGCVTTMPTSIGARIRYQLDRDSEAYKLLYKQRSANERINSQALALGIERPKLRNKQAIANHNTLIYILINLRALCRVRKMKADLPSIP